jgi:ArsR family transcriptional regulator, zinc-responsive transcriptional repressor
MNHYENFFINFANKNRLKIILCLKEKSMNVSEIVKEIEEEQSAVSHNLKILSDCKIVKNERKGKEKIYSLNEKTVLPLLEIVDKHVEANCKEKCSKFCKC